jgi:hypothetical protein
VGDSGQAADGELENSDAPRTYMIRSLPDWANDDEDEDEEDPPRKGKR